MKLYLAAKFPLKDAMKERREDLNKEGIFCTSRWLDEASAPNTQLHEVSDDFKRKTAEIDIEDIINADVTVLFTEDPTVGIPRGGRHFESGFAYGQALMSVVFAKTHETLGIIMRPHRLITVGPRENVFHYLPMIDNFPTWEAALKDLVAYKKLVDAYDLAIHQEKQSGNARGAAEALQASKGILVKTRVN